MRCPKAGRRDDRKTGKPLQMNARDQLPEGSETDPGRTRAFKRIRYIAGLPPRASTSVRVPLERLFTRHAMTEKGGLGK